MKTNILKMMINEGVGANPCCVECRENEGKLSNALSPWIVCEEQYNNDNILFVGKIARGDSLGEEIAQSLEDVIPFGTDFIKECSWAYWSYTRSIIETVYNDLETGLRHISFTNMIKCNNESTPDTSSYNAKVCCLRNNKFIWKEIELLKPRIAVFYTNTDYDEFIEEFQPSYSTRVENHTDRNERVQVRGKTMPWWDRSFYDAQNNEVFRFLRVGHPERKSKEAFVGQVSEWILKNK